MPSDHSDVRKEDMRLCSATVMFQFGAMDFRSIYADVQEAKEGYLLAS